MNRPIAISLSPNTSVDDVLRAWKLLWGKSRWTSQTIIPECEKKLENLFLGHQVVLTSSGRQALATILSALQITQGDEVVLQAFTCIAVPAAIKWVGAKPVYVDIDAKTFNMSANDILKKITPKTKVIIIQHTFGIPAELNEIIRIAKEKNIIVIEDCAHALGATYNNQLVGTYGDIAFLSFGRDKCISSIFGGAVISKNSEIINVIRKKQSELPLPPQSWVKQQLFHPIVFTFLLPWYFIAGIGKVSLVFLQKFGLLSKAVESIEKIGQKPAHVKYQYSPALAHLLSRQLDKVSDYTARRQAIAERYMKAFSGNQKITLPRLSPTSQPSWLRFPLVVENSADVLLTAREQKMLLGDWYTTPLAPADSDVSAFEYVPGMCLVAEKTAKQVINLPTYPSLTDEQVEQVISFINEKT